MDQVPWWARSWRWVGGGGVTCEESFACGELVGPSPRGLVAPPGHVDGAVLRVCAIVLLHSLHLPPDPRQLVSELQRFLRAERPKRGDRGVGLRAQALLLGHYPPRRLGRGAHSILCLSS